MDDFMNVFSTVLLYIVIAGVVLFFVVVFVAGFVGA